jgi:hypothetical protein
MAIKDLTSVVPPPVNPIETGDKKVWKAVGKSLGIALPEDYHQFATTYGSGSFADVGRVRIIPYNPFSPAYQGQVEMHRTMLEALKAGEGEEYVPFGVFPESPGLLAWGTDDNGNELYWLTSGKPSSWKVIVRSPENAFEQFDERMTAFLAKLFKREIASLNWPEPFFSDPSNIRFEPDEAYAPESPTTNTIYELYVENGNRAGFWARNLDSQPGVRYLIRLVDGKAEGPLSGIPTEYGRPPVICDAYLNEKLYEKDLDLVHAYQPIFFRL